MTHLGLLHIASAVYLSVFVAGVLSINENESPAQMARETLRRSAKLLGALCLIGLIVAGLSRFS